MERGYSCRRPRNCRGSIHTTLVNTRVSARIITFSASEFSFYPKIFILSGSPSGKAMEAVSKLPFVKGFAESSSPKATDIKAWGEAVSAEPQDRRSANPLPEREQQSSFLLVAFSDKNLYSASWGSICYAHCTPGFNVSRRWRQENTEF